MKIIVNRCFGGFGLSHEAVMLYAKLRGLTLCPFVDKRDEAGHLIFHEYEPYDPLVHKESLFGLHYSTRPLTPNGVYEKNSYFSPMEIERDDPSLIKVIEQLKEKANDFYSNLKIVEIPDGVKWEISDYDGMETIHEAHRSW